MEDLFLFLISILFVGILVYYACRGIKKANTFAEKIAEIVLTIVTITILVIYYLDRYNIPSKFNLTLNMDTQNWILLVGNYITGVISALIGALVAVWTTIFQIRKNNEENDRRDKENLRIQNMPILKYDLNTEQQEKIDLSGLIDINKEQELETIYNLNIKLKNIGMNSIKNIIIDYKIPIINNSTYRILGKDEINPIEKGEIFAIKKYFGLKPSNESYEMHLIIYYEDVLGNWYKQEIKLQYNASNTLDKEGYIGNLKYEVKKELQINENEIDKNVV